MSGQAIIYCRISRDPKGKELGVKRQERACRELCEREGLQVLDVIVDNDLSAYSGKPRRGWDEVRDRIKNGGVDVLVGWAADRFTRRPRELEDLVDLLEETGVKVRTVNGGEVDLTTSDGRLHARILGNFARHESERKSERLRAKAAELAQAGKVGGGGDRAFGFEKDRITHRPEEAEAMRWAAGEIVAGASLRSVARRMPVPPVNNGEWSPVTVRNMLTRPRAAGLREHRGEVVGEAVWGPILDRELWERVRAVLSDPRRRTYKPSPRYLMTGTGVLVDHLGRKMFARPNDRGVRRYMTKRDERGQGCFIEAEGVDRIVLDLVRSLLAQRLPEAEPVTVEPTEDIAALEFDMAELARLRGEGVISMQEWIAARQPLQARLAAARAALGPLQRPVDRDDLLRRWDLPAGHPEAVTDDEKRRAIREYISEVRIMPAVRGRNFFDASRVVPTLRIDGLVVPF